MWAIRNEITARSVAENKPRSGCKWYQVTFELEEITLKRNRTETSQFLCNMDPHHIWKINEMQICDWVGSLHCPAVASTN